jgi:3-dehydroquinate synthetase
MAKSQPQAKPKPKPKPSLRTARQPAAKETNAAQKAATKGRAAAAAIAPAPKPTRKSSTKVAAKVATKPSGSPTPKASVKATIVTLRTSAMPGASYEIVVGAGLLGARTPGLVGALAGCRACVVAVDAGLGPGVVEPLIRMVDGLGLRWGVVVMKADEHDKSMANVERLMVEAARLRLERSDAFVALGGGIVGDLTGFAAASYRRGVNVVQCPTTLLAMVDASVGGKTGVNLLVPEDGDAGAPGRAHAKLRLVKNVAGAFHQPRAVIADVATLSTLAPRELRSGLAECLKHALIGGSAGDPALLGWTLARLDRFLALDAPALSELVVRNVRVKARVVAKDERETSTKPDGGRMMLNLGHTFAHAIETLPGLSWHLPGGAVQLGPLTHGEAVALGLLSASRVSESLGLTARGAAQAVGDALDRVGLPRRVAGLPPSATIIDRMMDDKKTSGRRLRLILPVKGLKVRVVDNPRLDAVVDAIDQLRADLSRSS